MDLPIEWRHNQTTALAMHRSANAWLDNAAVLLECDAGMFPSYALRGVYLHPKTSNVRLAALILFCGLL